MMASPRLRWLVPVLALVVRLAFLLAVRPWDPQVERRSVLVFDSVGYHEQAVTLLEHHRFARSATAPPDAITAPIYPLLVAACYGVFGKHPWAVLVVQCLLGSLTAFLLAACMSRWFGATTGFLSGLFYALDPLLVLYCSLLVTDTLFVLVVVVTLGFLSRAVGHGPAGRWVWYGLAAAGLGAATLVRPAGQFLILILLSVMAFEYRRRPAALVPAVCGVLVVFTLVISPWLIRNARTFGHAFLTTAASYNLLVMDVGPMLDEERHQDWPKTQAELHREANALMMADGRRPEDLDAYQRSTYWRRVAFSYIRREPVRFAACWARGMIHTFLNLDTSVFALMLGRAPGTVELGRGGLQQKFSEFYLRKGRFGLVLGCGIGLWFLFSYGAGVVGLVQSLRGPDRAAALMLAAMVVYFAAVAGAGGLARYKLPAIPCYLPFTACGAQSVFAWARRRGR